MCLIRKKKELETPKILPALPKEYQNMQILLQQAVEWRNREEARLEKQTLVQLREYLGHFTEERN